MMSYLLRRTIKMMSYLLEDYKDDVIFIAEDNKDDVILWSRSVLSRIAACYFSPFNFFCGI